MEFSAPADPRPLNQRMPEQMPKKLLWWTAVSYIGANLNMLFHGGLVTWAILLAVVHGFSYWHAP